LSPFFNESNPQRRSMLNERPEPLPFTAMKTSPPIPIVTARRIVAVEWMTLAGVGCVLLLHPQVPSLGRALLGRAGPTVQSSAEYCAHVLIFFLLAFAGLRAPLSNGRRLGMLAATLALAVATEVAQCLVPTRGVNPWDAACNLAGVAAAWMWAKRLPHQKTIAANSTHSSAVSGELELRSRRRGAAIAPGMASPETAPL
jgi:VanZ family protein